MLWRQAIPVCVCVLVLAGACRGRAPVDASPVLPGQALGSQSAGERVRISPASALQHCSLPSGLILTAGPWLMTGVRGGVAVSYVTGGEIDSSVVYAEAPPGGCDEETLYAEGKRAPARAVPPAFDGAPSPAYLYSATIPVTPDGRRGRRICYGIELPANKYSDRNRYFCKPDLEYGMAGTSFPVPAGGREPFSFFAYGDVRDLIGFNGVHQQVAFQMLDRIAAELRAGRPGPDMVLHSGDYAYFGCDWGAWISSFFAPARPLLQQLPLATAPGNHEGYWQVGSPECPKMAYYFSFFDAFYARGLRPGPSGMYAFDHGNARFVSLALPSTKSGKELTAEACSSKAPCDSPDLCGRRWLQCQLSGEGDPGWSGIDHVFVLNHAPMVTAAPARKHGSSEIQIRNLAPLFERPDGVRPGKVRAVIAGHNHFYGRSVPLSGLCLEGDPGCPGEGAVCDDTGVIDGIRFPEICWREDRAAGVHYVISGGGGAEIYEAAKGPFPMAWLAAAAGAYHYVEVEVDGPSARLVARGFFPDGRRFHDEAVLR